MEASAAETTAAALEAEAATAEAAAATLEQAAADLAAEADTLEQESTAAANAVPPPPNPPPPSPLPTPPSPPPVVATVNVVGTVTLDGYTKATFGATEQTAFKTGIAKFAKVSADAVTITVNDARRRLLAGVSVEYTIVTADAAAAAVITKTIADTPLATVVAEMKAAGLTEVTTVTVTIIGTSSPPPAVASPPPVVADDSAAASPVAAVITVVAAALALFMTA